MRLADSLGERVSAELSSENCEKIEGRITRRMSSKEKRKMKVNFSVYLIKIRLFYTLRQSCQQCGYEVALRFFPSRDPVWALLTDSNKLTIARLIAHKSEYLIKCTSLALSPPSNQWTTTSSKWLLTGQQSQFGETISSGIAVSVQYTERKIIFAYSMTILFQSEIWVLASTLHRSLCSYSGCLMVHKLWAKDCLANFTNQFLHFSLSAESLKR